MVGQGRDTERTMAGWLGVEGKKPVYSVHKIHVKQEPFANSIKLKGWKAQCDVSVLVRSVPTKREAGNVFREEIEHTCKV